MLKIFAQSILSLLTLCSFLIASNNPNAQHTQNLEEEHTLARHYDAPLLEDFEDEVSRDLALMTDVGASLSSPHLDTHTDDTLALSDQKIDLSVLETYKSQKIKKLTVSRCSFSGVFRFKDFFPSLLSFCLNSLAEHDRESTHLSMFDGIPALDISCNFHSDKELVLPKNSMTKFETLSVMYYRIKDVSALSQLTKTLVLFDNTLNQEMSLRNFSRECTTLHILGLNNLREIDFEHAHHIQELSLSGPFPTLRNFDSHNLPSLKRLFLNPSVLHVLQNPCLAVESLSVDLNYGDYQGEISTLFPNVKKLELSGSIPHNLSIMPRNLRKLQTLSVFTTSELYTQQYRDTEIGGLLQVTPTVSKLKLRDPVSTVHNTLDRLPRLKKLIIQCALMEPFFIEVMELPNIQVFGLNEANNDVSTEAVIEGLNRSNISLLEVDMGILLDIIKIDVPAVLSQCNKIKGIALKTSSSYEALRYDNLPANISESLRQNFFVQTETLDQPDPLSTMRKTDRKLLFKKVKPKLIAQSFPCLNDAFVFCVND